MKRLLLCIVVATALFGGTIVPELETILQKASPTDMIEVIIQTKEQVDWSKVPSSYSRQERIDFLKFIAERAQRDLLAYLPTVRSENIKSYWLVSRVSVITTPDIIRAIAARSDVDFVLDNAIIKLDDRVTTITKGDATDTPGWNIDKVKADSVWAEGYTGAGIVVSNIDTGVDNTHTGFGGRWRATNGWFDGVSGQGSPYDDNGHGTHTMGSICGGDGNGPYADDVGVAPGANFIAAKAFDASGSGQSTWIQSCFDWIAGTGQPDVCSNSWSTSSRTSTAWFSYCQNLRNVGIITVFAIGNTGPSGSTSTPPGSYPVCISAGATTSTDDIASFSGRGPAPNQDPWSTTGYWSRPDWNLINPTVAAPGSNIVSFAPGGGTATMSGTSMSCPHVAGACALLLQKKSSLTHNEIFNLLSDNADHVPQGGGTWPNNNYGWGRLNCLRAINAVTMGNMPNILLSRVAITGDGNGNGRLDPGENADMITYVANSSDYAATSLTGVLTTSDPYITVNDPNGSYGTVAPHDSANNNGDRYHVTAASGCPQGHVAGFTLNLTCAETTFVKTFSLTVGQQIVNPGTLIWGPRQIPSPPAVYGLYGMAYNPHNNRLYATHFRSNRIYVVSSDSLVSSFGTIAAPSNETACTDIKYCAYDNTFWVASNMTKRVYKIDTAGTVKRYFTSPANDYPVGLGWDEATRTLYLTDRRAVNTNPDWLFACDTLGNQVQTRIDYPFVSYAGARCLGVDLTNTNPNAPTLVNLYTWFNTSGGLDSICIYELKHDAWQVFNHFQLPGAVPPEFNSRGCEYDPRDGNIWISVMQDASNPAYDNSIMKVAGFHQPTAIEEPGVVPNPGNVSILHCYPNPFRTSFAISYELTQMTNVRITIHDISGREIAQVAEGRFEAGSHTATWHPASISNGIYFVNVQTGADNLYQKVVKF